MESVYLGKYPCPRDWCSEKINLKTYFESYAKELSELYQSQRAKKQSPKGFVSLARQLVPKSSELSNTDMAELLDGIMTHKFTANQVNLKKKSSNLESPCPTTSTCIDVDTLPDKYGSVKNGNNLKAGHFFSHRKEVVLKATEYTSRRKDLTPRQSYIVSFRIHDPFEHRALTKERMKPGGCMQQVWVLNQQSLAELRDLIICEADYQDVRGDVSAQPDAPVEHIAKEVYPSSMFYIGNTFYIDTRKVGNKDYSQPVLTWGKANGIEFGQILSMEDTTIDQLDDIRMGYPYLFMHQGFCEHLVIISDARLLTDKDSLNSSQYPILERFVKRNMIYCMTCSRFPARWIVRDCPRVAHDPTLQCKTCFRMFNYINGKKVDNFKAYLLEQRNCIL